MGSKNAAAVALGRLGGLKGGKARAKNRTPAELSAIGRKGAQAREKTLSAIKRQEVARIAAKARWAKERKTK